MAEGKPDYIEVLVASAHPLVREALVDVLDGENGIKIVGQVSNRLDLLEYIHQLKPDVVIVNDEDSKKLNSLEVIRLISQGPTDTRVLLLIEDYDKDRELAALEAGVRGLLPEGAVKMDLIKCIRAINRGELWVRREVMGKFVQQLFVKMKRGEYLSPSLSYFTKREIEVIVLVCKGYKNKEIAKKLFISEKTVKYYLTKIFRRLNIKRRGDIRQYF